MNEDDFLELAKVIIGESPSPEVLRKAARLHATVLAIVTRHLGQELAHAVGELELAWRETEGPL
jgi:hypothetical protein